MKKSIHHVCIQTNDYEASLKFYSEILGFDLVKETRNFHGRRFNSWLQISGFMIELQTSKNNELLEKWHKTVEGIAHMCFMVADVHAAYKEIKSTGYNNFKIKENKVIYKVEDGYLFKVIAPEGTIIEFRDSKLGG
ncbi:MAG TPA: VOC family protein [Clostridia bacterium]|nr:VOC family protein [Clostridia bacterium]